MPYDILKTSVYVIKLNKIALNFDRLIHEIFHTNKSTNFLLYISLKLFTLKHFHCSYMFG